MKAEIVFETLDMAAMMDRFGKKIPGLGLFGKTLVKNPKNLETFALPAVKKILKDKKLDVEVKKITINAEGSSVSSVSAEFGQIDYAGVGVAALPMIGELLQKKKPEHPVLKLLDVLGPDAQTLIRTGAANVSDAKKELLLKTAVTEYQSLLVEKLNGLIAKKKLPAEVAAVRID